jgi:hypothetical protein
MTVRRKLDGRLMKVTLEQVYNMIDVNLMIANPKVMLTHHRRTYHIENMSNEPIQTILHGISTDVPKSFRDLNIRTSDESGQELEITSIRLDDPYQKEFTTTFNRPIVKGETDRYYTLEYEVEEPERYFENSFSTNCKKYNVSLIYPSDANFKPIAYVNVKDMKVKSEGELVEQLDNNFVKVSWTWGSVVEGQAFRLEW